MCAWRRKGVAPYKHISVVVREFKKIIGAEWKKKEKKKGGGGRKTKIICTCYWLFLIILTKAFSPPFRQKKKKKGKLKQFQTQTQEGNIYFCRTDLIYGAV